MATLILTTVGGAIGGPVGAALGGVLGGAIDRTVLFAPKGREGPRLSELKLQTSSYGTPIPKLFGTMRVAGTVIWATDLKEHRDRERGGKGQPSVTRYSYTASFAVALSSRPILAVRRIWAEGKLLRGAAGDWKADTRFRLHLGGEDQPVDPLIAQEEAAGLAPAHRGVAYGVFEDLALEDFGNRIPSLTFEVEADEGPVSAGAIATGLCGDVVPTAEVPLALDGFAAEGDARAVLELLARASGARFGPAADGKLAMLGDDVPVASLADAGLAAGERGGAQGDRALTPADQLSRRLVVAHYDPARDFQVGTQRAERAGAGRREERLELPAALGADAAKAIAAQALARMQAGRVTRVVAPGLDALDVAPGAPVTIAGEAGRFRVARWTLERMALVLELVPLAISPLVSPADPGRVAAAADQEHGPTTLVVVEPPPLDDAPTDAPRLLVAANGVEAGWRRAALLLSMDGGGRWASAGATAAPATIGRVVVPAGGGGSALVDWRNTLEVELLRADMVLGDADSARLDAGANLAMAGTELIQFAEATPLGGGRWRLAGLWRGRRGTEAAIGSGGAGDPFVVLEPGALASLPLGAELLGTRASVLASGIGDATPATADTPVTGRSVRPLSPVHLRQRRAAGGDLAVSWARRSRAGWRWLDGSDAPLGEGDERYRYSIVFADGRVRDEECRVADALVTAADRLAGARLIEVRQLGRFGASDPARLTLLTMGDT